jgi:SAM-dependent methyltransferase
MGVGYGAVRRPEPRIATQIEVALGDATSVINVGAGTGSYEPSGRDVTAVEPSQTMIEQRPPGSAPVVQGVAEALPFEDDSFDAAMAIITVHHWTDVRAGLEEMARVARQRVVVLTFDPMAIEDLWIVRDYFPRAFEYHVEVMPPVDTVVSVLPGAEVEVVPTPNGCADGFFIALWDRPELHLDPSIRRASSSLHRMPQDEIDEGVEKLRADLASGHWDKRNGHLRAKPELDIGLRLVTAELP